MHHYEDLGRRWREHAEYLRRYGAGGAAVAYEDAAHELESLSRVVADELLMLTEAATLSGLSAGQLGRMVRNGTLKNYGRKYAPRLRRSELPKKSGDLPPGNEGKHTEPDRLQVARSIVNSTSEAHDG